MTRAEELADQYGITEAHDENCQGDGLCREHFIEKLEEAFKKYGRIEMRGSMGGVQVVVTLREDHTRLWLFERHRRPQGPPLDPEIEAMRKAMKREYLAKLGIRMA